MTGGRSLASITGRRFPGSPHSYRSRLEHEGNRPCTIQVPVRRRLGATVGPFDGTFTGTLTGDEGSSTTATASFTHSDNAIVGKIALAPGLKLKFGFPCKLEPVDVKEIPVSTIWDPSKPRHAEATATVQEPTVQFGLSSIEIKVTIVADLSLDGKTISASVTLAPQGIAKACGSRTLTVLLTKAG